MTSIDSFVEEFNKYDLGLHGLEMPKFEIDHKYKAAVNLKSTDSNFDFLRALALNGFKKLNIEKGGELYKKYIERAKYELETVKELEFTDYFLLVWDVLNYCKENDIPRGYGRGSSGGSLILYLIDVTKVDPIKYNLYFERFISKTRAKKTIVNGTIYFDGSLFPDVDIDICYYNRYKVINYLKEKFAGRTSKILTINTLSGKLCIKECGKIIDEKDESEMTEVASHIPKVFGVVRDLNKAYEESPKFKEWCDENEEIYKIALKLENLPKNKGVHPSGYLLSAHNLDESCPTELSSDKDLVSSYDMKRVGEYYVKLDLLGLRGVSVIDDCCKSLGLKMEDTNTEDPIIYQNLYDLKYAHGLFQIEAETNFKVCRKVRPRNIEQLSAVLALARPGSLSFVDSYAQFTNDNILPEFDIESQKLKDILSLTGGCLLFQETAMRIVHEVFGLSLLDAESVRKATGKKLRDEMLKYEQKIKEQGDKENIPKSAKFFWDVLIASADYSFCAAHSCAYSLLSACSIYLKFKHPQHFFLSLLKMAKHEPDPIGEVSKIERELWAFGIELLPPHLIKSQDDFSIEGNNIRFGLTSIKGISEKTIQNVNKFRGQFKTKFDIFESAEAAGLSINVLASLIQAGCLEGFKQSRSKMVYEAQLWNKLTQKEKVLAVKFGEQFDQDLVSIILYLSTSLNEKGKPYIKDSRLKTIRTHCQPYKEIYQKNSRSEKFANWFYENSLIGYSVNYKLRDVFIEKRPDLELIKDVNELPEKYETSFIGTIKECKSGISREKKTKYFKMLISDETASITTMIFSQKIVEMQSLNSRMPEEEDIVIVVGKRFGDAIFADTVAIQTQQVYTKFSQLKADKKG